MFSLIFGGVLLVLGIPFFIIGVISAKRAKAAQSWPTIPGTVINSLVKTHTDYDSDTGSTSTSYEPVVEYHYSIMGEELTGTRIAYGANRVNYKKSEEIVSKYPVGSQVLVHYNPDKVADCTLETRAAGGKIFTGLGIVFLVLGIFLLIFSLVTG